MPLYQWTGRTPAGDAASGSLQASSKEAAIAALRARNILVATITERTVTSQSGGFGRMFIGLLLIAGAILMAMMPKRQAPSFETWQIETPLAAVALVLAIVGVWLFLNGARRAINPVLRE